VPGLTLERKTICTNAGVDATSAATNAIFRIAWFFLSPRVLFLRANGFSRWLQSTRASRSAYDDIGPIRWSSPTVRDGMPGPGKKRL